MTIFLADYVPYSIIVDAIRTMLGVHLAFMVSAVTLQGIKFSWEGGHGYCLSERKKQNSNRVKGVEVLSILTKVKNAKKGNFLP
jgi:hypothetical protein